MDLIHFGGRGGDYRGKGVPWCNAKFNINYKAYTGRKTYILAFVTMTPMMCASTVVQSKLRNDDDLNIIRTGLLH